MNVTFHHSLLFSVLATPGVLLAGATGLKTWSHFWEPFKPISTSKMDPKIVPKLVQRWVKIWSNCGSLFRDFGGIQMPFVSLLGPSQAVLDSLGTQKANVFKVFANAGVWYFEVLDGPLVPILAPLEPIWSQNGSPKWPQI